MRSCAQLYDVKSLQLLKTYKSDRPLNAGAISPIYNHVILGGGQEAKDVTTTAGRVSLLLECVACLDFCSPIACRRRF